MNEKKDNNSILVALVACISAAILFLGCYSNGLYQDTRLIQLLMRGLLILCILPSASICIFANISGSSQLKSEKQVNTLIAVIIVAGIIMRIGYMLYTPYALRGHDVGLGSNGHADYIITLLQGHLPDSNEYQYYHPPLFHLLAAGIADIFRFLTGVQDTEILLEAGKLISCWSSILTLFLSIALCRELELGNAGKITLITIAAFLPEHYLLAGRLNNDALSIMFMTAIIIYTLKWHRRQSMYSMIILALCYGLGMMTKVSVGTFTLVTGTVMLIVLFKGLKNGNGTQIFLQYLVFSIIAFPLGMWYPVRNLIRFDQPLNYVTQIETTDPLYCGDHSMISRFLPMADNYLYADPRRDFNVWTYLLKTSVFGEFQYNVTLWIAQTLLICAGILAVAGLIAMFYRFIHKPSFQDKVLAALWSVMILSYLWFNANYPFGCTMDFRYIVPTALVSSIFLGKWADIKKTGIASEMSGYMLWIALGMFCLTSCLMYTLI